MKWKEGKKGKREKIRTLLNIMSRLTLDCCLNSSTNNMSNFQTGLHEVKYKKQVAFVRDGINYLKNYIWILELFFSVQDP